MELVAKRLRQKIADLALGVGVANVEGMARHLVGSALGTQERGPDLRTVAVGYHKAIPVADQADYGFGCPFGIGQLLGDGSLFARANQGVAAHRDEHRLGHKVSGRTAHPIAAR
jgi:hypothetical protein